MGALSEEDREIGALIRRAQEPLKAALRVAQRSARSNARAQAVVKDLFRTLRALDSLPKIAPKYPVEEPKTASVKDRKQSRLAQEVSHETEDQMDLEETGS